MTKKSKPQGRTGESFTFYMAEDLAQALRGYLDTVKPKSSKKAVLELALEEYLAKQGFWPPSGQKSED